MKHIDEKRNERIRWLYFNWWRIKDIAEDVGLSESAVKSRIRDMRERGVSVERWSKRLK